MKKIAFWENLGALLATAFIMILAFFLIPDPRGLGTHEHLHLPPCLFHWLTGWPCPGCGLTTSFAHFSKLNFQAAFHAHPMGPFLFLITLGAFINALLGLIQNRSFWSALSERTTMGFSYFLLGGLTLTWIYKIVFLERSLFAFRSLF